MSGGGFADAEATGQARIVLTPHPLQRVGAYALAALGGGSDPEGLGAEGFRAGFAVVVRDAVEASVRESKAVDGFWQKASLSFFPNAPMNHPGRWKGRTADGRAKSAEDVRRSVREWLSMPEPASWPAAGCVLCGRRSVGFFGKRDVVLAESEAYRNTTPRGHEGMALCWPCVCCFYALPYGAQLSGGSSVAVHSWDEGFLRRAVGLQAGRNLRIAATGNVAGKQDTVREVVALEALRGYGARLADGVELLVFNNNNRGQLLESHGLAQPLAEWLRRTCRLAERRRGFRALVRAHTSPHTRGVVALARNAFRDPERIVGVGVRYLGSVVSAHEPDREEVGALAGLLFSFATEVMQVIEKDLAEIRETARRVGGLLAAQESRGPLRRLRAYLREPSRLRGWLTRRGVEWAGAKHEEAAGPLVSERAWVLLFDPSPENPAWFHRDLLLVGVLEELSRRGWQAAGEADDEDAVAALHEEDQEWTSDMDEDGEDQR
ncbi:hypothetical protein [Streptomyces sp. NBC_01803]|uniref:hypothetical protein n=1 Tax=Streptomyces sp. NBC_01803 TaxID=2975946 RepID=UPI002DDB8D2A|nr:hypothetical protein [Streptomyces sp. NBC_01803]WSA44217.1 hypothetical protein OIE51_08355 [Streptomyces sp. NBC_01803]